MSKPHRVNAKFLWSDTIVLPGLKPGHLCLRDHVILRLFEESRVGAVQILSAPSPKNSVFVVRAQEIKKYDSKIGHLINQTISTFSSISEIGNSSIRLHNMLTLGSMPDSLNEPEKVIVEAIITIVLMDLKSGKKVSLPDNLKEFYGRLVKPLPIRASEFTDTQFIPRSNCSAFNPKYSSKLEVFSSTRQVQPSDLDLLNHVNHARYLMYFEDIKYCACQETGFKNLVWRNLAGFPISYFFLSHGGQLLWKEIFEISIWPLLLRDVHPEAPDGEKFFGFECDLIYDQKLVSSVVFVLDVSQPSNL